MGASYLVLTLVLASIALILIYARPLTQTIAVGSADDRAATLGFNAAERNPAGVAYRWSDDRSTLIFRAAGLSFPANRPLIFTLTMAASRPAGATAPQVALDVNGVPLDRRTISAEERPRVALGGAIDGTVDTRVTLTGDTFTPPGDRRALGVAVLGPAQLVEENSAGIALPPLAAWWRWLLLIACGWGVALGLLRRPTRATIAGVVLIAAFALAAVMDRPRFWEFNHLPLLLLVALLPVVWRDNLGRFVARLLSTADDRGVPTPIVTLLGLLPLIAGQALLTSNQQIPLALLLGALGIIIILATLVTRATGQQEDAAEDAQRNTTAGGQAVDNSPPSERSLSRHGELLALAAILALAAAARFYNLGAIPFGMWRDEARHGLEALRILTEPGYRPIYIPNISLPGLYPTLLAADFKLFGASLASLRGLTAGAGVLAIVALWVVARQLWGPHVALVAALLGAVGSWRVSIDRLAFDTAPTTLCTLAAFALFLTGVAQVRRGGRGLVAFALSGVCGGLAIYNYYPGRFALPVLAGAAIVLFVRERDGFARRCWPGLILCIVVAALTLVPLGQYAVEQPDNFFKRTEQVFVLSDQYLEGRTKLEAVEQNIMRHIGMFNWRGEPNARHHAPNWPMLDVVTALCFAVGLALVIIAALRFSFPALFMLGWLVALLAPSIVSVDAPSAVRAQDAAPAAYLLAAVGLVAIWERLRGLDAPRLVRRAAPIICGAALVLAVAINLWIYFIRLPGDPRVLGKFQYVGETRAGLAIRAAREREPGLVAYVPSPFLSVEALHFTAWGTPLRELPSDAAALLAGPLLIIVPRGEERDFDKDVAEARRVATAAGLREVPGERTPGGAEITYVAFMR
jgi:4-amino-4-deoxy-L-arabinose transferase-like glycosyltransferase